MDYCLFWFFLICPHPPPSTPQSSPVLCNFEPGESAGRTLNWKLVMAPPSPPVAGHWLFLFFFLGKEVDIKLIIKPARLCPAPSTYTFIFTDPGNSSIPII